MSPAAQGGQKMTQPAAFVSAHAIQRYQERVDPTVSRREALRDIREVVNEGKARPRPRHWTHVDARPGSRYVYWAGRPGVCVVMRDGAVVTVFSRQACSEWRPNPGGSALQIPEPYHRPTERRVENLWSAA